MRWLGIIALSLLALVPTSSSNGDKLTSILPSTIPSANNETDSSSTMLNSTGISTILIDTGTSLTDSTVDPPIDNLTTVVPALGEGKTLEQGNDIEYSSTNNVLELTPSREDDEEVKDDETGSSQVDNIQAEPSRSRDVESQPQSGESPPAQATNSSDLDKYSADELEVKLNEAKTALEKAKETTAKEREELTKREKAAVQPNQDYDDKKKEWEKLEEIALEKETADREFKAASKNVRDTTREYTEAESELELAKEELEKFEKLEQELPTWPDLQRQAEDKERSKKSEEQPLKNKVRLLQRALTTKGDEFTAAEKKVNDTKKLYDQNNCDDPAQASSTLCTGFRQKIVVLTGNADLAKNAYNQAASNLKTAENDLEALLNELSDLAKEIDRLTLNIARVTAAKVKVKISELKKELEGKTEIYNNAKKKKEEAEAELEKKKTAKETAEQTDGGISAEAARHAEMTAEAIMEQAKSAKDEADGKVEAQKKILESAKQKEAEAKANVEKLEKLYEEKRKEEERQKEEALKKGSSVPVIVGSTIGGIVVLIGVGIGGFFLYKRCRGTTKDTICQNSRTPGKPSGKTSNELTPLAPQGNKSNSKKSGKGSSSEAPAGGAGTGTPGADPPPAAAGGTTPADGSQVPANLTGDQNETPGGLPDLANTPYVPGEEPFKIPAKNFKWRGPLIRRTRWHGEPKHLLEGKKGPEKLEKIWFDPNANYATEIGATEIMEDGGPPSDSNRSEWLNNLDEWEKGRKAMLAAEAAAKGGKPDPNQSGNTEPQKPEAANDKKEQQNQTQTDVRIENRHGKNNAATGSKKSESTAKSGSFSKRK